MQHELFYRDMAVAHTHERAPGLQRSLERAHKRQGDAFGVKAEPSHLRPFEMALHLLPFLGLGDP